MQKDIPEWSVNNFVLFYYWFHMFVCHGDRDGDQPQIQMWVKINVVCSLPYKVEEGGGWCF